MKWLMRIAVVSVACLGAIVGSSQRARRGDAREMLSTFVYPPQRIAIRMDHSLPAHRRLRCARCHEGATASTQSTDLLIPREAACVPCHEETDRERASDQRCGTCHVGARGAEIPASHFPPPRLTFSHRTHSRAGVRCLDCHEGVTGARQATREHLPSMRRCWDCHGDGSVGGHRDGASSECGSCHQQLPSGRLRTQRGHDRMLPPRWLHGMDHDRDFLVRHRWVAADRGDLCAQCHEESECVDCHDGRVRMTSVHRNDFLTTHGPMARRDEQRCASCHTTQRFCTECHARLGLAPTSAPAVMAGGQFHPAGWVNAHGQEARRSMTSCTSCHVESDCVVCHGASGIGAGLSPHPPGYASRCSDDLGRNGRACRTCHGDAELSMRCR